MNNINFGQIAALLMCCVAALAAAAGEGASDTPPKTDIWEDHLIHPLDAIVLTDQQIDRFLARLSQSNPNRAAELEKIRITQPQRFRWEIREEMTNRFFQKAVQPAEPAPQPRPSDEIAPSPSEAAQKQYRELMAWLETAFPAQAEELKSNPAPSESRIGELVSRYEPVMRAERSNPPLAEAMKEDIQAQMKCDQLLLELPYVAPTNRESIIEQINQLTARRFDLIVLKRQLQQEHLRSRLERLSQELDKQKEELDALKKLKEQAVAERVAELIGRAENGKWD